MALTGLFCTGFEHGVTPPNAGLGFSTVTGSPTIVAAAARNGGFGFRSVTTTSTAAAARMNPWTAPAKCVIRFAYRCNALPAAGNGVQLGFFHTTGGSFISLYINPAGALLIGAGNFATATAGGASIAINTWNLIELQIDASANPMITRWKVNGVTQTQLSTAIAASTVDQLCFGPESGSTTTSGITQDFDDVIVGSWTVTGTDWWGDGRGLSQLPGLDGFSYNTVSSLSPGDAGTAYSTNPPNAYLMVDDPPGTGGWTTTRSTTDNIALRVATPTTARVDIAPVQLTRVGSAANNTGAGLSGVTTAGTFVAQSFKATAGSITRVMMKAFQQSSPTGTVDIRVVNDNGGVPGSTVIASITLAVSSFPVVPAGEIPFTDVGLTATGLAPSATYWLQMITAGGLGPGTVWWQNGLAADAYPNGTAMTQALTDLGHDQAFEITFAGDTKANVVRALMSYSSSATQANLAACDVRNQEGVVTELWGITGGVGQAYNVTSNAFKGGIVATPTAGWSVAEVNAVRFRFGGCTSADISPVPTVQAMMLEVDWPIVAPALLHPAQHHRRPGGAMQRRSVASTRGQF